MLIKSNFLECCLCSHCRENNEQCSIILMSDCLIHSMPASSWHQTGAFHTLGIIIPPDWCLLHSWHHAVLALDVKYCILLGKQEIDSTVHRHVHILFSKLQLHLQLSLWQLCWGLSHIWHLLCMNNSHTEGHCLTTVSALWSGPLCIPPIALVDLRKSIVFYN